MEVILIPKGWRVWLRASDRTIAASEDTPAEVVEYLSRDDLRFGGSTGYEEGVSLVTYGPERRAIQDNGDLITAVANPEFRERFGSEDYDIGPGPEESLKG